jgi:hypothetical protein
MGANAEGRCEVTKDLFIGAVWQITVFAFGIEIAAVKQDRLCGFGRQKQAAAEQGQQREQAGARWMATQWGFHKFNYKPVSLFGELLRGTGSPSQERRRTDSQADAPQPLDGKFWNIPLIAGERLRASNAEWDTGGMSLSEERRHESEKPHFGKWFLP